MHVALTMSAAEREQRAEALRKIVRSAGVRTWFYDQVDDALSALKSQDKKVETS